MNGPWTFSWSALGALCVLGLVLFAGCGDPFVSADNDPDDLALIRLEPRDGESDVNRNTKIRMTFNGTVLPDSVHDQSIRIRTGGNFQTRPEGSFLISGNVVEFDPTVTEVGGANSLGLPAGSQVLVDVPIYEDGSGEPSVNFLQNVEGDPIKLASGASQIAFTTGSGWQDPVPGAPGLLGLEFVPAANSVGQVPSDAAVTAIFNEPIDPSNVILGKNIFLTNNTPTSIVYQLDIPSITFFDGSLTKYTFQPVFGFGQGPFNILVNFIDPDEPDKFDPEALPVDLGGNRIQNFTFAETFDTQFDPFAQNTGLIREDFTSSQFKNTALTDAHWGDDSQFPFALVSQQISTRVAQVDIVNITSNGAWTDLDNAPTGLPRGNEDYCPTANPLVGPDLAGYIPPGNPSTSDGRRQQNLYRQAELGGGGTVIRVGWGPESDATFAATYRGIDIYLGHKRADTSLVGSGFFSQFDVDGFVKVVDKADYSVPQAADINGGAVNDGYLDWPQFKTFFEYDGENDLLIDIQAEEGNTFQTFRTYLGLSQLSGAPTCNCVTVLQNACNLNNSAGQRQMDTIYDSDIPNPAGSPAVANPAPFVHVMEFELAKLRSDAESLYYDSRVTHAAGPDFLSPIINPLVQAGGATVEFTWSASLDGIVEDVPFTPNINACDGFRWLRWHAVLRSNIFTSNRARVELVEVPYTFEENP
jgi:hypothetical protein